ncbi:hypothetical protein BCIN_07g01790 [Botrytis cinerea B05.10]|uniref:Uncharacterized protein n=1 Tax=Botryotinia fuckeliana (strain B05.10) TaxID=332648 RepID=A0A384JLV6_BOTFB|nr:hypothetical protein BCIN_07g01790 [Botrytis cinerea B05.10]ATZ51569.1 hypothetical protein BCIN_07g01790 [Botrytis cinerea B05.10]
MNQVTSDISSNRKITEAESNNDTQFENDCEFLPVEPSIGKSSSRVVKLIARSAEDDVPTPRISHRETITNSRDQISESSRSLLPNTCYPKDFIRTNTLAATRNSAIQRAPEPNEDWDPAPLSLGSKYKTEKLNFGKGQSRGKTLASADWHQQANLQARTRLPDSPIRRIGNTFGHNSSLRICEPTEIVPLTFPGSHIWNTVDKLQTTAPQTEEDMELKPSRRNEYRRIDRLLKEDVLPSQEIIDEYETSYGESIPVKLQVRIDVLKDKLKVAAAAEKKRKAQAKKENPRKTPRINTASSPASGSDYLREPFSVSPIEEEEERSFPAAVSSSSPFSVRNLSELGQHGTGSDRNRPVSIEDDGPLDFRCGSQMKDENKTIVEVEKSAEIRTLPEMTHTAVTTQAFRIGAKTVGIANKLFDDLSEAVMVLKHTRLLTGSGIADEVIRNFERSNYTHKLEKPRFFFLGKSNDTHPHFMINGAPSPSRFIPMFTIPMTENDETMLKIHQQNVLKDSALFQASATGGHNPITWYSTQETWKPKTKVIAVTEDEYNHLVEVRKTRYDDLTMEGETGAQNGTNAGPRSRPAVSATGSLRNRPLAHTSAVWPKWAEESWEHQRTMVNRAKHVAAEWNKEQRERVETANTNLPADKQVKFESVEWERFMRVTGKPRAPIRSMEYFEEEANIWDSEINNDTVLLSPGPAISNKEQTPSPLPQVQNPISVPSAQSVGPLNQQMIPLAQSMSSSAQSIGPLNQQTIPLAQSIDPSAQSMDPSAQSMGSLNQQTIPSAQSMGPSAQSLGPSAQSMGSLNQQTVPSAQSLGPSAQSLGPSAQPIGPSAQSMGPSAQSMGPSAQSLGPSAQSLGPSAQPIGPSAQSMGPSAQSMGPSAQSLGPSAQSLGPSAQPIGPSAQSMGPSAQSMGPSAQSLGPSAQLIVPTQMQNSATVTPVTEQQPVVLQSVESQMPPPRLFNNTLLIDQPKPIHNQNWHEEHRFRSYGNDTMESSYPNLSRSYTASPQFQTSSSGPMQHMRIHGLRQANDMQIPRHFSASPILSHGHSSQAFYTPDPSTSGPVLNGSPPMHQDLQQQYTTQRFPHYQFQQHQFPQHQFPQHQFPQHQFPQNQFPQNQFPQHQSAQHHAHQGQIPRHDSHFIQPEYSSPVPVPFVTLAQVQNSAQSLVQTPDLPGDDSTGESEQGNQTGPWEEQE